MFEKFLSNALSVFFIPATVQRSLYTAIFILFELSVVIVAVGIGNASHANWKTQANKKHAKCKESGVCIRVAMCYLYMMGECMMIEEDCPS